MYIVQIIKLIKVYSLINISINCLIKRVIIYFDQNKLLKKKPQLLRVSNYTFVRKEKLDSKPTIPRGNFRLGQYRPNIAFQAWSNVEMKR